MSLLSRLDARFGRYSVANVTLYLIAGQALAFAAAFAERHGGPFRVEEQLMLVPNLVLAGEVWRLVTFLFMPPSENLIFALFFWGAFYLCGTVLERVWGTFRYNAYLIVGYAATIAAAFAFPDAPTSNFFLKTTVFLAFAHLNPDFTFSIYGLIPIRSKWLALLIWLFYIHTLWIGDWPLRVVASASFVNYFMFFGRAIWRDLRQSIKHSYRRAEFSSRVGYGKLQSQGRKMAHQCHVCGLTNETSPRTPFRYCSECGGDICYCPDHLQNHEHVKSANGT